MTSGLRAAAALPGCDRPLPEEDVFVGWGAGDAWWGEEALGGEGLSASSDLP